LHKLHDHTNAVALDPSGFASSKYAIVLLYLAEEDSLRLKHRCII